MTVTPEEIRLRLRVSLGVRLPMHRERMGWSREHLVAYQRDGLRRLLTHAIANSPFHAARLHGVRPDHFELDELPSLPVMTKAEMMDSFDDVVTDRRLTRASVEAHVAAMGDVPEVLEGDFFALTSGGSSGRKGLFVYDFDGVADLVAELIPPGGPVPPEKVVASVSSPSAAHASGLGAALRGGQGQIRLPVTLPLAEMVRRLNERPPDFVFGYPSVLRRLAREQQAGRLSIRPERITVGSEQLEPEAKHEISAAFDAPVFNTYGTSEGLFGTCPPGTDAFTFATDFVIVELVDERNEPVAVGTPSARILVTNLFNTVQPLIRYAIDDRFVRRPDAPDHGHLVATVEGRRGGGFIYGDTHVHIVTVLGPVVKTKGVVDYRIRQTPDGLDVEVVVHGDVDPSVLEADVRRALSEAGLRDPNVSVRIVDHLERDPATGKVRRLLPLEASADIAGERA